MIQLRIIILFALLIIFKKSHSQSPTVIPLWKNGAPGYESRKNEPEQTKDWWVKNIHNPSITIFKPAKEKANGTAIVIFPGGGQRELVFNAEGKEAAEYLVTLGITAIAVKYRLAFEPNSPYKLETDVKADAQRAMRLVRSMSKELGIAENKIGIMGFSAGAVLANMLIYDKSIPEAKFVVDDIDKLNDKPNFQILIYPPPFYIPKEIPSGTPPVFMLVSNDDEFSSDAVIELIPKFRMAKVPLEAHIFTKGKHGFNMGNRSEFKSINNWPGRLADWLLDMGM
jgi:acetyl esterase/lipase